MRNPEMVISTSSQRLHGATGDLPQLAHSLFNTRSEGGEDVTDESVLDSVTAAVQARPSPAPMHHRVCTCLNFGISMTVMFHSVTRHHVATKAAAVGIALSSCCDPEQVAPETALWTDHYC